MRVDAFWMGARAVAERFPLAGFVEAHGGWAHVERTGLAGLRAAGLPEALVQLWRRSAAGYTSGVAVRRTDPAYPASLAPLPDAPPVLFVDGDVASLAHRALGVVGTRKATTYGRQVARELGRQAARCGFTVVSGLARGIDREAHEGALDTGRTVAVLAHGLSFTAPSANAGLRRRMVANGGAVVTTLPDGAPPRPFRFPPRNRWIAGLSSAVVVVEAPVASGAMHTVRAAADYGREVFAVPGPITSRGSEGTNRLLADGATPVVGIEAFIADLGGTSEPASWVDRLVAGDSFEAIARQRGCSLAEVLEEVEMMEAVGELVRLPGARFARGGR